jgi:hypothetical protein
VRRLKVRHHADERLDETSPHDRLVTAIDAALTFASTRELFTGDQVCSMLDMVRLVSAPGAHEPPNEPFGDIASAFAQRALVASGELVDELLDLRLRVVARAGGEVPRTEALNAGDQPLVSA